MSDRLSLADHIETFRPEVVQHHTYVHEPSMGDAPSSGPNPGDVFTDVVQLIELRLVELAGMLHANRVPYANSVAHVEEVTNRPKPNWLGLYIPKIDELRTTYTNVVTGPFSVWALQSSVGYTKRSGGTMNDGIPQYGPTQDNHVGITSEGVLARWSTPLQSKYASDASFGLSKKDVSIAQIIEGIPVAEQPMLVRWDKRIARWGAAILGVG